MVTRSLILAVSVLAWPYPSTADPIRIVEGSAVHVGGSGRYSLTLVGDSEGFTLQGGAEHIALGPVNQCIEPECVPGVTVSLHTSIASLTGEATFRDQAFSINPIIGGNVEGFFDGGILIPEGFAGGTLTAPFTFAGLFRYPGPPNDTLYQGPPLMGQGTATLTLAPWNNPSFPDAFVVQSFRYDFTAAEPVPEPGSMLLIASGLGSLMALRKRRRSRVGDEGRWSPAR